MIFKDYINKFKRKYVINKVKSTKISKFTNSNKIRNKYVFSGKVQKVGFRLELSELAKRLNLTGWVKNRDDGKVEAELQGEANKISFLVKHMESLKRASIDHIDIEKLPLLSQDYDFIIKK